MSHTKSGCDHGAAAEAGVIREQVASKRSKQAILVTNYCTEFHPSSAQV